MAESTLTKDFDALMKEVAFRAGADRSSTGWTTSETATFADWVNDGVNQVYDNPRAHSFSFLRATRAFTLFTSVSVSTATPVVSVSGGTYDSTANTTALTATAATFFDSMIGRSIVITGIGTFAISEYTSTTVITVAGDASSAAAATFSIDNDEGTYKLPDDVNEVDGPITYTGTTRSQRDPLRKSNDVQIRIDRMQAPFNGIPEQYAITAFAHVSDGSEGQRLRMFVNPAPSGDYPVQLIYSVRANRIDATNKYAHGVTHHGELFVASCKAVVERELDRVQGQDWNRFLQTLDAAIVKDTKQTAGENLGYNHDQSELRGVPIRLGTITHMGRVS